jgi:hypothetical protein
LLFLCSLLLDAVVDAIEGWTLAEQDAWIANPQGRAEFHSAIGIVDATYIYIERPKNVRLERITYSTYKKRHAVLFLALIDRQGTQKRENQLIAIHDR